MRGRGGRSLSERGRAGRFGRLESLSVASFLALARPAFARSMPNLAPSDGSFSTTGPERGNDATRREGGDGYSTQEAPALASRSSSGVVACRRMVSTSLREAAVY